VVGFKESYLKSTSRLLSFGCYLFKDLLEPYPELLELLNGDRFDNAAKTVCPANKQYLDPAQFNFIVQIPGQTVALHVDGVYFWGASRFEFPQWLLAVMKFSGLYEDKFIDQVQVVAYLHNWTDDRAGQFVYWNDQGPEKVMSKVQPYPRTGTVVDGSKTVHAAMTYQPEADFPDLDKDAKNTLVYTGDDEWSLRVNDNTVRTYHTEDLRITIVYRGKCFESQEEAIQYQNFPKEDLMELETILNQLADDLISRGRATRLHLDALLSYDRLGLANLLMDEYIKYPLPQTDGISFPYNYCALPRLLPWTAKLVQSFC